MHTPAPMRKEEELPERQKLDSSIVVVPSLECELPPANCTNHQQIHRGCSSFSGLPYPNVVPVSLHHFLWRFTFVFAHPGRSPSAEALPRISTSARGADRLTSQRRR
eukprot:scaffold895_cov315-Pinguiococcus_pyrenoidosus.AAC.11